MEELGIAAASAVALNIRQLKNQSSLALSSLIEVSGGLLNW